MENGASALLSAEDNAAFYSAQFEDACAFLAKSAWPGSGGTFGATLATCAAWSDSIMLAGINSVVAEYADKANLMTDRRMRARVFNASGAGRIVNADAYNYSDSICIVNPDACAPYSGINGIMVLGDDGLPVWQGPGPGANLWGVGDITPQWLAGSGGAVNGADLLAHNSTPYSLPGELNGRTMRWLEQANALYLAPALKVFCTIYLRTGLVAIDNNVLFLNLLVPTFLSSFALLMVFVFLPHIKATNEDIQGKRAIVRSAAGRARVADERTESGGNEAKSAPRTAPSSRGFPLSHMTAAAVPASSSPSRRHSDPKARRGDPHRGHRHGPPRRRHHAPLVNQRRAVMWCRVMHVRIQCLMRRFDIVQSPFSRAAAASLQRGSKPRRRPRTAPIQLEVPPFLSEPKRARTSCASAMRPCGSSGD